MHMDTITRWVHAALANDAHASWQTTEFRCSQRVVTGGNDMKTVSPLPPCLTTGCDSHQTSNKYNQYYKEKYVPCAVFRVPCAVYRVSCCRAVLLSCVVLLVGERLLVALCCCCRVVVDTTCQLVTCRTRNEKRSSVHQLIAHEYVQVRNVVLSSL